MYGGGGVSDSDGDGGGSMGGREGCGDRAEPVLVLLSDLYLLLNSISVGASGPSSCPTSHCLLIT